MMNLVLLIYKIQSDFAYDLTLFLRTIKGKCVQRVLLSKKGANCTYNAYSIHVRGNLNLESPLSSSLSPKFLSPTPPPLPSNHRGQGPRAALASVGGKVSIARGCGDMFLR